MLKVERDMLKVERIRVSYQRVPALHDVSLLLKRSEIVAIVGGIDGREGILWRKNVVDTGSAEVFANGL